MVRSLLIPVLVLLLLGMSLPAEAITRYASSNGAATSGCTVNSDTSTACTLLALSQALVAGDVGLVKAGEYSGANGRIAPLSSQDGTSGSPITIKPETYGTVWINGGGTQIPMQFVGVNWWVVEGFNAYNSSACVLNVGASGLPSNDNVFRYNGLANANVSGNNGIVCNQYSSRNTFYQNFLLGTGRKGIAAYLDASTLWHNNFVFWQGTLSSIGGHGSTWAYNAANIKSFDNIIMVDIAPANTGAAYLYGPDRYNASWPSNASTGTTTTHSLKGNIIAHIDGQNIDTMNITFRAGMNNANVEASAGTLVVTVNSDNNMVLRRNAAVPTTGMDCGIPGAKAVCTRDHWTDGTGAVGTAATCDDGGSQSTDLLNLLQGTQPANCAWLRYLHNADGTMSTTAKWPWGGSAPNLSMDLRLSAMLTLLGNNNGFGLDRAGTKQLTPVIMAITASSLTTPNQLLVTSQPVDTVVGTIIPGFETCIYDTSTPPVKQIAHATAFTIAKTSGTGTLSGTTTGITNGCWTFNGLTIDTTGAKTLTITNGALTVATSGLDITAVPSVFAPPTSQVLGVAP